MRIDDDITKCVGFVSPALDRLRYSGTAFWVSVPFDERTGYLHLVTAKHVADAVGSDFVIGMNGKDGHPLFVVNGCTSWFHHPTEPDSVDVAVMPFASERTAEYDINPVPLDVFATDERIDEYGLGLGDEVVSVGLFSKYFGQSTLIPVVRTGNIAMMPKEKASAVTQKRPMMVTPKAANDGHPKTGQ